MKKSRVTVWRRGIPLTNIILLSRNSTATFSIPENRHDKSYEAQSSVQMVFFVWELNRNVAFFPQGFPPFSKRCSTFLTPEADSLKRPCITWEGVNRCTSVVHPLGRGGGWSTQNKPWSSFIILDKREVLGKRHARGFFFFLSCMSQWTIYLIVGEHTTAKYVALKIFMKFCLQYMEIFSWSFNTTP